MSESSFSMSKHYFVNINIVILFKVRFFLTISKVKWLANDADIPISQIGRVERGELKTTIGTLFVIAKALDISVKDLFGFEIIEKSKN